MSQHRDRVVVSHHSRTADIRRRGTNFVSSGQRFVGRDVRAAGLRGRARWPSGIGFEQAEGPLLSRVVPSGGGASPVHRRPCADERRGRHSGTMRATGHRALERGDLPHVVPQAHRRMGPRGPRPATGHRGFLSRDRFGCVGSNRRPLESVARGCSSAGLASLSLQADEQIASAPLPARWNSPP